MSSISSLQNLAAFSRVRSSVSGAVATRQEFTSQVADRRDLLKARTQLERIFRAVDKLADLMDVETRFQLDLPDARSTSALGLDLSTTAATLQSTDEINASPNSFTPFGPEWAGLSTAALTIGGEYDGSDGTDTLTFEVRRAGIKGIDNLRIRVEDSQGDRFNVNIRPNDPPDMEYSLNNGLFFTLGAGLLINGETTTIDVFQGVGSAVNPDNPLGGLRNSNPNFQYYPSPNTLNPVVDGSFELNGETISVGAAESLNDIVDRINLSNAGVTATFNAVSERIEFVQDMPGSVPTIDIQNDTSNLIVAAKLDAAVVQPGTDPEDRVALQNVAQFSTVQSGDILINGTPVAVDVQSDSLEDVIAGINASAADVNASFDPQTQRVTIEANDPNSIFEIDSNGTNFFASLNIVDGRVDPVVAQGGISRARSYDVADAFETLAAELNAFYDDQQFVGRDAGVAAARSVVAAAIGDLFDNPDGVSESQFGIKFDRSDDGLTRGGFADLNRKALTRALQVRGDEVKALLAGPDSESGLLNRLINAAGQALKDINTKLGFSGSLVDTFA